MELTYDVAKEKGSSRYFAYSVKTPHIPVFGSLGDKKHALHVAADCMGISYKDYMKLRRKAG
jgi:hypothetical protein